MKLPELAGPAPRQTGHLISQESTPPPSGVRARASYGEERAVASGRYMRLKRLGFAPATIRVLLVAREGEPFPVVPGVTLILDPQLIAPEAEPEPLLKRIADLLPKSLEEDGANDRLHIVAREERSI